MVAKGKSSLELFLPHTLVVTSDGVSRLGLGPETFLETRFLGLGLEGLRSRLGLGLELFVSRLCIGYFL